MQYDLFSFIITHSTVSDACQIMAAKAKRSSILKAKKRGQEFGKGRDMRFRP